MTELAIHAAGARVGMLRPIGLDVSTETAALLTRWREHEAQWFLTQFKPTVERTLHWLRTIVAPDPTRLMFVVHDDADHPVGTIGLLHLDRDPIEIDNVLRGEPGGVPHLMTHALAATLAWVFERYPVGAINLFVLFDNVRAIRLYERLGFVPGARYALTREERPGEVQLRRAEAPHAGVPSGQHLLEMRRDR